MRRKSNGTCVHEWECSHFMQATSKGLRSLLTRASCVDEAKLIFLFNIPRLSRLGQPVEVKNDFCVEFPIVGMSLEY